MASNARSALAKEAQRARMLDERLSYKENQTKELLADCQRAKNELKNVRSCYIIYFLVVKN